MANQSSGVQSVAKVIKLLDLLAEARQPLSLREIAVRAGFPKSTAHALLATMLESDMVEQSETDGKYRLGVRLFELGSIVSQSWDVISIAKPHMKNIMLQTGESAHLAMLSRNKALILDKCETMNPLRVVTEPGAFLPLYCTALGKAMLAFLSDSEIRSKLSKTDLISYTPHTLVDLQSIIRDIAAIRDRGAAIENGEYRIGLRAVAAPIFDRNGRQLHSIGVTGMFRHIDSEIFQKARELVIAAAQSISADCGYRNK